MVENKLIEVINNLTEEIKTLDNTNKVYLQTVIELGAENTALKNILEKYKIQLKISNEQRDHLKESKK